MPTKKLETENNNELEVLSRQLSEAFNIYSGEIMKLSGYKDSKNYWKLSIAIEKSTGITLSNSTLRDIITLKHKGKFNSHTIEAIDKFISTYTKSPTSFGSNTLFEPVKQKVFWGVNQGFSAGIFINSFKGEFIGWEVLKKELELRVISQCPRIVPPGSKIMVADFYGKKQWVVRIIDKDNNYIGSIWLGGNPLKNWFLDGFVRIGHTHSDTQWEVYQILQRYSDGSYRIVKSFV